MEPAVEEFVREFGEDGAIGAACVTVGDIFKKDLNPTYIDGTYSAGRHREMRK